MDRLTVQNEDGDVMLTVVGVCPNSEEEKPIRKLFAYEDTDLTPEGVVNLQKEVARLARESIEREKALARLEAEVQVWADAERDGQLVVLPYKLGDTVYVVREGWARECEMKVRNVFPTGIIKRGGLCNVCLTTEDSYLYAKLSDFGKTVFFTREDAEAALSEMKEATDG